MMRRLLAAVLILCGPSAFAQGDFVVNYRGLITGRPLLRTGYVDFYRTEHAYRSRLSAASSGQTADLTWRLPPAYGAAGACWIGDGAGNTSLAACLLTANNLGDVANAATARTNLGLSAVATMAPGAVAFTGGTITGITDVAIADGGTGASTAAAARANLGLQIGVDVLAAAGNAGTATALAANGSNCAPGTFPLGVDALGASETCTAVSTTITDNSTVTSGCYSAGGILMSVSNVVQCNEGMFLDAGVLSIGASTSGGVWTNLGGSDGMTMKVASSRYGSTSTSRLEFGETSANRPTISPGTGTYLQLVSGSTGTLFTQNNGAAFQGLWENDGDLLVGNAGTAAARLHVTGVTGTKVGAVFDNGSSTGAIACFQDGGVDKWCFLDGGTFAFVGAGTGVLSRSGVSSSIDGNGFETRTHGSYGFLERTMGGGLDQFQEYGIGKALAEGVATNVTLVGVISNGDGGFEFQYGVMASDGSLQHNRRGSFRGVVSNDAGTESCTLSAADETTDGSVFAGSGTLTYAISCLTTPTNGVYLAFTATSSLVQTTLRLTGYTIRGNGNLDFTPQ